MSWGGFRRGLQTVHLWAGLALAVPFVLLGISGSLLMLQPELPRMSYPYATGRGEVHSVARIMEAAAAVVPGAQGLNRVSMPQRTGEPAILRYGGQGTRRLVFVDPVNLEILDAQPQLATGDLFTGIRTLHATLYMSSYTEKDFVGWIGVALTLLSLSGLVLWWPRGGQWKAAFGIKRGATGHRLNRDLHSTAGFWTLGLYLVVCISGIYLAFPREFRNSVGSVFPLGYNYAFPEPSDVAPLPPEQWLQPDAVAELALGAVENARLVLIDLPGGDNPVAVVTLVPANQGMGAPPITISVDAELAQVSYVDDPRDYLMGDRVVIWQRYLHSGLGLGFAWRALVFVSGFLPLLFAITGIRMWWLKRAQRRLAVRATADAATPAQ